jgi:flagellin
MSIVVNTNIASMNAQRSLATSGKDLQEAMQRLSTGMKINSAADDAAGFAIAESMTAQVRGLTMSSKNASDALGLLKVVENASNDVTDMLQRVRELAVQAKSGTNSVNDIKNLQGEADALMTEITRVSTDTTYNGKSRIGADSGNINIQVGYNDGNTITLKTYNVSSSSLSLESAAFLAANKVTAGANAGLAARGLAANIATATAAGATAEAATAGTGAAAKEASLAGFATTASNAAIAAMTSNKLDISSSTALTTISAAVDKISGYKAEWGAGQNRLEYTVSNLMNVVEFTSAARSRIQDADFAAEAAKLAKAQVLQQTGAAMLAQANAAPQLALQLIK